MAKRTDLPKCKQGQCFANTFGSCAILNSSDWPKDCPFFKTQEQMLREQEITEKRIESLYRISYKDYVRLKFKEVAQ